MRKSVLVYSGKRLPPQQKYPGLSTVEAQSIQLSIVGEMLSRAIQDNLI